MTPAERHWMMRAPRWMPPRIFQNLLAKGWLDCEFRLTAKGREALDQPKGEDHGNDKPPAQARHRG